MQSNNTPNYHNLDIRIGIRNGDVYPVNASSEGYGEAFSFLQFPYTDQYEFREKIDIVYSTLLEMRRGFRRFHEGEKVIKDFGQLLFSSLITGDIHTLYRICLERTRSMKKETGLRLRLHIADPELATIPWEYLYDPNIRNHISFYHNSPVVRYMDVQRSTITPRVKPPLKLLCMISSPTDLAPLDVQREKSLMLRALDPLLKDHMIEVKWLETGSSYNDLQNLMRDKIWHIFHFIGHGGFDRQTGEGYLYFCGNLEESYKISASQLTPLLAFQQKTLKLVFLNTCEGAKASEEDMFSSLVGNLMSNGVLSVIAMQQSITDRAAITFSRSFYTSISHFMPIDASVSIARVAMAGEAKKTMEWGIPALYMRADNGTLFQRVAISRQGTSQPSNTTKMDTRLSTNTRKRKATNRQPSIQTLQEVAYKTGSRQYKRSSLNASKQSILNEIKDFLEDTLSSPSKFLHQNLNRKKFKRYYKNLLGFFFFLALDIFFISVGVYNWLHLLSIAIVSGFILSIAFLWNCLNEDTIVCIILSLLVFGGASFGIGMFYFHQFGPIAILTTSILLSFLRTSLFKPTK